jgi:hypothetical protein
MGTRLNGQYFWKQNKENIIIKVPCGRSQLHSYIHKAMELLTYNKE